MDAKDPAEREREHRNIFTPRSVVDSTFWLIDENKEHATELTTPMIVFVSTDDDVIDSAAIEEYFNGSHSSPKKLVKLDNSAHMIPVDYEWKAVVSDIAEFIEPLALQAKPSE